MKAAIVLGTRPEIIKMSPLVRECAKRGTPYYILHTGQHYSHEMDRVFFDDLSLPEAQYHLDVGSGTHGVQTAKILTGVEGVLMKDRPDIVLVQGDTNTVMAAALAASKLGVRVGHVEAGLRSNDRTMPEETNRVVADHISDQLYAPTEEARKNLLVFQVRSFEEQIDRIAKVVRLAEANDKIGLIIVDSMTMYYRLKSDDTSVRNEFVKQTEMLLNAARKSEVAVLLTSQVYTNIGAGTIEFLGGHAMHHNAKTIIRLEKKGNGRRVAVMVKHRSIPEGRKALYSITEKGISD